MIALTLLAVVVTVLHPVAWTDDEMRFAVGGAGRRSAVLVVFVALATGDARVVDRRRPLRHHADPRSPSRWRSAVARGLRRCSSSAGRSGFGPLAATAGRRRPRPRSSTAARPAAARLAAARARLLGIPVVWMVGLPARPAGRVYVVSYIPWAMIENHQLFAGWPPGHTGQTLLDLTRQMYDYHNSLTAAHPASSPWWAWPLDLKPVWFYQEGLAGGTSAAIYDAGNLVIWWLGIPALAFVAWQAFARRSLALALIAVAFACQWIAVGADRPGRVPVPLLHGAAVRDPGPRPTSSPSCGTGRRAGRGSSPGSRRRSRSWARRSCGCSHRPLCGFVGVDRAVPDSRPARRSSRTSSSPPRRRRSRSSCSSRSSRSSTGS